MPFEFIVAREHFCTLPTGHLRGRYGVGTIWRCPNCRARYKIDHKPDHTPPLAWVQISPPAPKKQRASAKGGQA